VEIDFLFHFNASSPDIKYGATRGRVCSPSHFANANADAALSADFLAPCYQQPLDESRRPVGRLNVRLRES
jgi:hypothetical protein